MTRAVALGAVLILGCYKPGPAPPVVATNRAAPQARAPSTLAAALADPVGFLPLNSELVFSLDVEQLRRSPLWGVLEQRTATSAQLAAIRTICGFDPMSAIRGLTLGIRDLAGGQPKGVAVVTGLPRDRALTCLAKLPPSSDKTTTVDAGIITMATATHRSLSKFVDETTLVTVIGAANLRVADLDAVIAAGTPLRRSPAFLQLVSSIDTAAAAWAVVRVRSSIFDGALGAGSKPESFAGALRLDNGGTALAARIGFATPAAAQTLASSIQGQLGALHSMFDRLDVHAHAETIVVDAELGEAKLKAMISLLGLARSAGQTPPPPGGTP